jgi:hypothetical protein
MMRLVLLFLLVGAATVTTAGAASRKTSPQAPASTEDLPIPPIPPDQDGGYLAAPVPNNGVSGPSAGDAKNGPGLSPGFYQPKDYNIGEGYLPGSTVQGEQEHRAKPMPSLKLTVPLE